jgi:hypothetical protein
MIGPFTKANKSTPRSFNILLKDSMRETSFLKEHAALAAQSSREPVAACFCHAHVRAKKMKPKCSTL